MSVRNLWQNQKLMADRQLLLESGEYEEVEGCYKCFESMRAYTMNWPYVPKQYCPKHPKYVLRKCLMRVVKVERSNRKEKVKQNE